MKPAYSLLKQNHYSSNDMEKNFKRPEFVYSEIGYDINKLGSAYRNTCAVRMSLALLKTGVPFSGRLKIKAGRFKGQYIEAGAKLLADQLMRPGAFGKPKVYDDRSLFKKEAFGKKGVVLFHRITGYGGGHIDLIETATLNLVCHSSCFFQCKKIWFWQLH